MACKRVAIDYRMKRSSSIVYMRAHCTSKYTNNVKSLSSARLLNKGLWGLGEGCCNNTSIWGKGILRRGVAIIPRVGGRVLKISLVFDRGVFIIPTSGTGVRF